MYKISVPVSAIDNLLIDYQYSSISFVSKKIYEKYKKINIVLNGGIVELDINEVKNDFIFSLVYYSACLIIIDSQLYKNRYGTLTQTNLDFCFDSKKDAINFKLLL